MVHLSRRHRSSAASVYEETTVRNMTSRYDTLLAESEGVLVVGDWWGSVLAREHPAMRGSRLERCPADVNSLRRCLAAYHPVWLVMGEAGDEADVELLLRTAWQVHADLKLAMLGPLHDLRRCERWLRRGAHVYLSDSTPLATALAALECAAAVDVTVVDRAFHLQSVRSRHVGPLPSLTDRQQEVLGLLGRNLTNAEIGAALHVSENTVEFHIRRLLAKLGARNRMQAVRRASDLGLI
jgi:DNA-binding NarL/FixJ family response regulator